MIRKLIQLATVIALATFAIPKASADTFALNIDFCSQPCGGTGSVTLTLGTGTGAGGNGIPTGDVKFDVTLNGVLHFHQTNGLDAFNFNGPAGLSIVSITSGYNTTLSTGQHEDGAGTFGYTVTYGTNPGIDGQELIFVVSGSSLALSQFEVTSSGGTSVDFAANVSNGTCTGLLGGGNGTAQTTATTLNSGTTCTSPPPPPPGVPEPTSVLLLGTGLAFAGKFLKKYVAA